MGYADVFRALHRRATIPAEAYVGYEALVSGALAACGLPANDEPIHDSDVGTTAKREVGEVHPIAERAGTRRYTRPPGSPRKTEAQQKREHYQRYLRARPEGFYPLQRGPRPDEKLKLLLKCEKARA
jgi:hypothetical protein